MPRLNASPRLRRLIGTATLAFGLGLMVPLASTGCAGSADAPTSTPSPTPVPDSPAPEPGPAAELGQPFTVGLHSTATVGRLIVTFAEITEDSRCPEDVDCVWAGRATIRLTLQDGATSGEALPQIGGMGTPGDSAEALGYRFTLQTLMPYPNTSREEEAGPVEATLLVESTQP